MIHPATSASFTMVAIVAVGLLAATIAVLADRRAERRRDRAWQQLNDQITRIRGDFDD